VVGPNAEDILKIDPRVGVAVMIVLFILLMSMFAESPHIAEPPPELWAAFALVVGYLFGAKTSEQGKER